MIDAFDRGDLDAAREAQALVHTMLAIAVKYGGLPALKAMMQWVGVDCGPCRMPLSTLDAVQQAQLRHELECINFFEQVLKGPSLT
jgi:N-acetylneuraminate lyase